MRNLTPPNLLDFVGRNDHDEATLLQGLLADPATARLMVARRRSVADIEAAGDEESVRRFDAEAATDNNP